LFHSSKDSHERGFATAVRTNEPNALNVADAKRDVFENWLDAV
jgi:hypothetical protein